MDFSSEVLTLEVDGDVATLWLDRPEARNACGRAFWRDLPHAAAAVAADARVRVLIVAARGPHFCVGLDLKEMNPAALGAGEARSPATANADTYEAIRAMQGSISAIADLAVPVIAAVHGYCIGAGVDLIAACDVRLCSSDAVFSVRETRLAIVADVGSLQRLPGIINAGHLAELAFTGRDVDASRAASMGLVNSVHGSGAEDVYAAARELAGLVAANSPLAVRGTKAVLAANEGRTVREGLEFVARWNTLYLDSNDLREAFSAFLEKRPPRFRGD